MDLAEKLSAEHRDLLLELSLLISERRGVDEIFAAFADQIRLGITFDFTSLFVVTADPNFVRTVGNYPQFPGAWEPGSVQAAPNTGADRVEPETMGTEYRPSRVDIEATRALAAEGYERAWATPLFVEGKNYGMLSVAKRSAERFPPEHLQFLRSAATLLAIAVRQDLELERARRNAARAVAASELMIALQAGEPIDDIFQRLSAHLGDCIEGDYIGLILDNGAGFAMAAEFPAGVHRGDAPSAEGDELIRALGKDRDFLQFNPSRDPESARGLVGAGYQRAALAFLRDGEEMRGLLIVARTGRRRFDHEERTFIELLRSILSQTMENQRRLTRTEAAAARARSLNEVALLVNAGEEVGAILQRLIELLEQSLEVDYVGLLERSDEPGLLRQVGGRPQLIGEPGTLVTFKDSALDQLIANSQMMFQYSVGRYAEYSAFTRALAGAGMRRAMSVVIHQGNDIQGLLSLARRNGARFSADEEAFLETLSTMLAQAMESRQRLARARTEAARSALLGDLAILLNNGESLEAFFDILRVQLQRAVPFGGLVLMVQTAPDTYRVIEGLRRLSFAPDQVVRREDFGENILNRLAAGELVVEGETSELGGNVAAVARSHGTIRGAVAAIRNDAETVGYLLIGRPDDRPFTADECSFIELVCAIEGQAIANLRKVEDREVQAIRSRVLSDLSRLLEGGESIEAHFSTASEVLLQAVGFDFLSITTREPATGEYRYIRTHELLEDGAPLAFEEEGVRRLAEMPGGAMQFATRKLDRQVPLALHEAGFARAASAVIASPAGPEGILTIGRREDIHFTEDEMSFIGLLASLFGQAAANHQKAYQRAMEAARDRVLGELALVVNNGQPIGSHFERLTELLKELGFEFCALTARNPDREGFKLMRSLELPGDDGLPHPERIEQIRQLGRRSIQYAPDARGLLPQGIAESGINRLATVLLSAGATDEGLLSIGRVGPGEFTAQEMTFFELIGTLLAYAIANESRIAQGLAEAEEQAIIAEAAGAVARENDAVSIIRSMRAAVSRFIPMPFLSFGYLEEGQLRFPTKEGGSLTLPLGAGFLAALETGQYLMRADLYAAGTPESAAEVARIGIHSHILTRAQSGGAPTGILVLGSRDPSFEPTTQAMRLCRLIADIVGPAMMNARATERQRAESEDQGIVAEAAAAMAKGVHAATVGNALSDPVSRFVPDAFVRFGYYEDNRVVFPTIDGQKDYQPMGRYFQQALAEGQSFVPGPDEREANGEVVMRTRRARLEGHVLTRSESAGIVVGFLLIGSRRADFTFGQRERRLCRLIGDIVGPAMANARSAEREREEAEDQAIIAAAASAVARESSPLAITRSLRGAVKRFIPSPYVSFGFLEPGYVQFSNRDGTPSPEAIGAYFTRAFAEGQVAVPATAGRVKAGEHLPEMEAIGIQAHLVTTALSAGTMVGLLLIGSRDVSFSPGAREARLCRLIADIVGPAMANARAAERERQEADDQRVLAEIGAVAAREGSPTDILMAIRQPFHSLVPLPIVIFGFREGDEMSFPQEDGTAIRHHIEHYAKLVDEQGQIHGEQLPRDLVPTELGELGIQAICATAVRSAGNTVGYLLVGSQAEGFVFGERELLQCRRIAQIVGPAMENARAAMRARQDAEEQRVLAAAASATARATDEEALVHALVKPISDVLSGARIDLLTLEGEQLRSTATHELLEIGPFFRTALEGNTRQSKLTDPEIPESNRDRAKRTGVLRSTSFRLSSGGQPLGILWVGTGNPGELFTENRMRLFQLIADIVGPALANLRENARRREDAEEQRFLAEAAAAAARATDEVALMAALRAPFRRFVPQARLAFFFKEGDVFRQPGRDNFFEMPPQVAEIMKRGQVAGFLADPDLNPASRAFFAPQGIHAWVDTTVASGGEALGLFFVGTADEGYRFSDRDLRLLRLVADIVGPAMANIRESRRRKEDAEEQRILAEAASGIAAGTSESDILNRLAAPVQAFVPRARVAFSYVEDDQMWLWDGRHKRPVHEHAATALAAGQAIGHIDETRMTDMSRDLIRSSGVYRWVDTTAHSGGASMGLLFVGTPVEDHEFSARDLRVLRLIADVTGPAMVNAREETRRQADAEDERVLSEIAAVAARANASSEIVEAIPHAIASMVPGAFALYGFIEGDAVTYQFTNPETRATVGSEFLTLPMTDAGRAARDIGQGLGTLAATPPDSPYASLGLQEYVLSSYASTGAPVGILLVSTTDPEFHFDERQLALLKRLAQLVGPAVEAARATAERERQAELYSLMLRSLSEGVVLSDLNGQVVFANAMGRGILRALDPSGTARNWHDIVQLLPEETREGYLAVYERGEGSRGRTRLEVNGKDAWFDYELVPLNDPVMKILLVAADVTADVERELEQLRHREQMEQAQRLAALGELIGGVAHELNNPLTAILGFAEVMSLSPEAEPLAEDLAVIQKEALRARNIVRDLLFIVRPGTSERSLMPVSELVGHIERLRRSAWTQHGIGWEINIQEPCLVWGNEHQLTQVLLNLVTNAEHALQDSPAKRIVIRAGTSEGRTVLSVSDTGAGMDDAVRGRVFEPFFTTKQGHGTGLGLPLSYSIVQSHDGEITVTSKPGEGTTFTISLPAAQQPVALPPVDEPVALSRAIRVLVVDDEPSLRKVCQRLVASMGHECATAENSLAAIELARDNDFDVVLCDYRLATETADAVVAGFERVAPQLIARIVIATGATTDPGVVELTQRYGLKLIAKPYGADDLAAVIHRTN